LERDWPSWPQALLAASSRTSHLAISLVDSQTRCESVNAAATRETGLKFEEHLGKTPREIVGDLAMQIEPIYEKVLRTGKPASTWISGCVRDSVEFNHWFDYTFPIFDSSHRVQQLGLIAVNVTAEKESAAILATLPRSLGAPASSSELLRQLEEAVQGFYLGLELSLGELSRPSVEVARKVDLFHTKLHRLDNEVRLVRELVYAVLAKFHIPSC
jgi:PAS domain S-box-containing protein